VQGLTDYSLARRAVVRGVADGSVDRGDVCDAHPELLQAARNVGAAARRSCPICRLADESAAVPADEADSLRLVTYVFAESLRRPSGIVAWGTEEIERLARSHDGIAVYTVECCLVCGWNHLAESYFADAQR